MDILRLAFELDSIRATKIIKKIRSENKKISNRLNELSK